MITVILGYCAGEICYAAVDNTAYWQSLLHTVCLGGSRVVPQPQPDPGHRALPASGRAIWRGLEALPCLLKSTQEESLYE